MKKFLNLTDDDDDFPEFPTSEPSPSTENFPVDIS